MNSPSIAMLNIGSELLRGRTVNTNLSDAARLLTTAGLALSECLIIHDGETEIVQALDALLQRHDALIITGGLGPTRDDMTKQVLARYFGSGNMVIDETTLAQLELWMKSRNRSLTDKMREQALVPAECEVMLNPIGTAPGMAFDFKGKLAFSIPGVPAEMNRLMETGILPRLKARFAPQPLLMRIIRTFNYPESDIAIQVDALGDAISAEVQIAYLPRHGEVKIEMRALKAHEAELTRSFEALSAVLVPWTFTRDDRSIEKVAAEAMLASGMSLACAESCTGGGVARLLTSVSGASAWFKGSAVVYAVDAKTGLLGVDAAIINREGVVSEAVAVEMAKQARVRFQASIGLGVTGTAEVIQGDANYEVPEIWFALADDAGVVTRKLRFLQDRKTNMDRAASTALMMLIQRLQGQ